MYVNSYEVLDDDAKKYISDSNTFIRIQHNEILWQHIPLKYLSDLLRDGFHFSSISSYEEEKVERAPILGFKKRVYIRNNRVREELEETFEKFNDYTYISCWFNNTYLIDSIYKRFADKDAPSIEKAKGIAIKTTRKKLVKAFYKYSFENCSKYDGELQYVAENIFGFSESAYEIQDEGAYLKTYFPYFYKNTNLADEMEYRLLIRSRDFLSKPKESAKSWLKLPIGDIIDGICFSEKQEKNFINDTIDIIKEEGHFVKEAESNMDGYIFFTWRDKNVE